tara:strand:+ start:1180 stop:1494 length:315 start_codon:yes stop_codon:yes gene_type:complete
MKVKTINISEINENSVKVVNIENKDIAIFNVDGEFYAIDDLCSHADASLAEGEVFDCKVECPLHGAEFDLKTGEAVTLPATRPVDTYMISVENDIIYLEMNDHA